MTDQLAIDREVKRIVDEVLGPERVGVVATTPFLDHSDEPALSVEVSMKSTADIPDASRQSALTQILRRILSENGDFRFPYLYVDALDLRRPEPDEDEFGASSENAEPI